MAKTAIPQGVFDNLKTIFEKDPDAGVRAEAIRSFVKLLFKEEAHRTPKNRDLLINLTYGKDSEGEFDHLPRQAALRGLIEWQEKDPTTICPNSLNMLLKIAREDKNSVMRSTAVKGYMDVTVTQIAYTFSKDNGEE